MEQEIIQPIDKELLKSELTPERQLRMTNKSNNEIYVITAHNSPNVMKEIGRLREIAFREAGGGTGKSMDIDEFDMMDNCYKQLIVWNPEAEEIIGGYRYLLGTDVELDENGQPILATGHMFHFSDKFMKDYMPQTIELGRSFVSLEYQSSKMGAKSLFALDNLWDGLGALVVTNPDMKYFFGKVTMYGDYNKEARDLLIYFLKKYFPDRDKLVDPIYPIELDIDNEAMGAVFCGESYAEDYKILTREIRKCRENIPPLINSYMNISPSMRVFGTVKNPDFGEVEETGILITISDIYPVKSERHFKIMD